MEIINTCTSGCVADAPVCKKEAPHSTLDEATPHPMSHIDYVKRRRIQSTVSWLPLRSWSLSKGNSNSDVVWCFAQQCWHQVATEPCFLGGSKRVALRFTTSRTKVMPSCLSVLFWCPSPVNHVCGGQITGSRELPREAKLPLLYFPFPVYSFKTTPPPEKPISDFFFCQFFKKRVKFLYCSYFHWIKVIKSQNKVYPEIQKKWGNIIPSLKTKLFFWNLLGERVENIDILHQCLST